MPKAKEKTQETPKLSPLHKAVRNGNRSKVLHLLDLGRNPNKVNSRGESPLHWAAFRGYKGIVSLLLNRGADPSLETDSGETPLDFATESKNRDIATKLKHSMAT